MFAASYCIRLSFPLDHQITFPFSQTKSLVQESRIRRMTGDSSTSYIRMVQHLIEKCLIFNMTKEECMESLSKHANIEPVITSTVWNELEKENREFFEAYAQSLTKQDRMSEEEMSQMIQKTISDSSEDHDD